MSYLPSQLGGASSSICNPSGDADLLNEEENEEYDDFDVDALDFGDEDENYDDVSVSGDVEPDENELNLAHKTSEIMSDYRAYLTEVTGTHISPYHANFSARSTISSNNSISVDEDYDHDGDVEGGFPSSQSSRVGGVHKMHREWAYNGNFHDNFSLHGSDGSVSSAHDPANIWLEDAYGDDARSKRRYLNYRKVLRSRKTRRGIIGVLVACAVIGVIVGIANSSTKRSSGADEEKLKKLMVNEMEEEKEREDSLVNKMVVYGTPQAHEKEETKTASEVEEFIQIPPKSTDEEWQYKSEFELVHPDDFPNKDVPSAPHNPSASTEAMKIVSETTMINSKPEIPSYTLLSSSSKAGGGGVEQDHVPTVSELQQKDFLEHYEAVAIKYKPRWYDRSKGWEGLSYNDALRFCATQESRIPCPYEAYCPLGPHTNPTGGFKETDGQEGSWAPIMDAPNGWVQISDKNTCMRYEDLHSHPPEWGLTGQNTVEFTRHLMCCEEPTTEAISDNVSQSSLEQVKSSMNIHVNTEKEQIVLDELHPVWFGREQGYKGTSHEDAVKFCSNAAGMQLCPIEAYCPNGKRFKQEKPLFLNKAPFQGEQWAPINTYSGDSSSENDWVLIGSFGGDTVNTCLSYDQINNKGPIWGLDGSKTDIKEHVMCCIDSSQSVAVTKKMETFSPQWLEWDGDTHEEAMEVCEGIDKKVCPYAVYCPHGPGKPAAGYHSGDFSNEGEQWAPVNDKYTDWVQLGQKHGNALTTCLSSAVLEGNDEGVANKEKRFKKHLMCCDY